jgi:extradiol dioxygenase family protein
MTLRPFHLAIPVTDLAAARRFYGEVLGCPEGRSSDHWVDFDFQGHQLVIHYVERAFPVGKPTQPGAEGAGDAGNNPVDGHDIPVPHFGIVLTMEGFDALASRITAAGVAFVHPPMLRFAGLPGEQKTMFLRDPSGNALEFKAFADDAMLFAV